MRALRWRRALGFLSPIYGAGARAVAASYERGWRRVHEVPCPVLSVGNLVVGGTGKTPVTRYLAAELCARGRRPGILLRGYRARGDLAPVPSDHPGGTLERYGDEALAHAAALPDTIVVAHPDRVAAAGVALAEGADVLVLDDGFQHRRLAREVDLVLLDWEHPLGRGGLLPAGDLREPITALARAHAVGWTRYDDGISPPRDELDAIDRARPARPLADVRWRFGPGSLTPLRGDAAFHAKRVVLVSGVARPESVARTATDAGLEIVTHLRFADHHEFRDADLEAIAAAQARTGADGVVVTEKDAARLLAGRSPRGIKEGTVGVLSLECEPVDPLSSIWQALGV